MRTPPPIATLKTVGEKVELVESLLQMEYTGRLIKSAADNAEAGTHPIDAFYDGLNTKVRDICQPILMTTLTLLAHSYRRSRRGRLNLPCSRRTSRILMVARTSTTH